VRSPQQLNWPSRVWQCIPHSFANSKRKVGFRSTSGTVGRLNWHMTTRAGVCCENAQRRFGISVDSICLSSVGTLAPGLNLAGLCGALYYPKDACVAPTDLLRALRIACIRRGVTILENSPVERMEAAPGRVSISMPSHQITGRNLVLAGGAWSSLIPISHSGTEISIPGSIPVKGHIVGYQLPPSSLRPILRHGHHYVVQRKNGFTLAGSSEERCGFNRSLNADLIREIRAGVDSFYTPVSAAEPSREWIGFRPGSELPGPVISRVQGTNIWLAYGHYRNGILLTPATAHLVSSEILADRTRLQEIGSGRLASLGV
jgi:glycine oxidase